MKKRWILVALLFLLTLFMVGCNIQDKSQSTKFEISENKSYESSNVSPITNTESFEKLQSGYYKIINKDAQKVLDGKGLTTNFAALFQSISEPDSLNQVWVISESEDSAFTIKNLGTSWFVAVTDNSLNAFQFKQESESSTLWRILPKQQGLFTIQSILNERYLDNGGNINERRLIMSQESSNESQLWEFKKISDEELAILQPEILPGQMYFPGRKWLKAAPETQDMNSDLLDQIDTFVNETKKYEILSLLVARNGVLVYEKYWRGNGRQTLFPVYSISKSFTSALIGIAYTQGYIKDLHVPVIETYFSDLNISNKDSRKDKITLHDMLTFQHGYLWNDNENYWSSVSNNENTTEVILGFPMHTTPGTQWVYHTGLGVVKSDIVERATGQKATDYYSQHLFEPLGIQSASWQTDNRGIPLGGIGLSITASDMLRLGHLYLNKGVWDGNQIISRDFIEKSVSPITRPGWGGMMYGYQWFVNEDLGLYYGLGSQGQVLAVIPSKELVIGVTSATWTGDTFSMIINGVIKDYILPSIQTP